jgi:hypothetical protein
MIEEYLSFLPVLAGILGLLIVIFGVGVVREVLRLRRADRKDRELRQTFNVDIQPTIVVLSDRQLEILQLVMKTMESRTVGLTPFTTRRRFQPQQTMTTSLRAVRTKPELEHAYV